MNFTLERDAWRRLVLIDEDGCRFEDVAPVRAFPLSDPRGAISICGPDGREVVFVPGLDEVAEPTRTTLETELAEREFVPHIRRVLNLPPEGEPSTWQVETDRGIVTFEVENEDSVHRRDRYRISIVDSHGIRYEIEDTRKLDARSRKVLDRFL